LIPSDLFILVLSLISISVDIPSNTGPSIIAGRPVNRIGHLFAFFDHAVEVSISGDADLALSVAARLLDGRDAGGASVGDYLAGRGRRVENGGAGWLACVGGGGDSDGGVHVHSSHGYCLSRR
jgi:hypothetical protein